MKSFFFRLAICLCLAQPGVGQVMWQFNKDSVQTWYYTWGDEFNGTEIDRAKWSTGAGATRTIYTNREAEYYTDGQNHIFENGAMKIIAKKEEVHARAIDWMGDNDSLWRGKQFLHLNKRVFNYTSGKLESKRLFNKGYFEVRFKAPADQGMWPAFWLAGGDPNEEIDILELKGEKPDRIHVDAHCPKRCDDLKTWYGKKKNWGGWIRVSEKLTEGFNVVSGEWNEDHVKYYLNGKAIAYVPVKFDVPKTLIVNMAIPSDNGPFNPGPAKSMERSQPFEIDYIRVWERNPAQGRTSDSGTNVRTQRSKVKEGNSELGKKNKFLFGKKAVHKDEGPQVSLLPAGENRFLLYLLGFNAGEKVEVEILGADQAVLRSGSYSGFQNEIDLAGLSAEAHLIRVTYNGKKAELKLGGR